MSTRASSRLKLTAPAALGLLVGLGGVVGYLIPNGLYRAYITVVRSLSGSVLGGTELASAVVMYLLGAVVYYGAFILVVKLLQSYGFLRGQIDLHSQAHFLVYGYTLLVVVDIALAQTPGSIREAAWYSLFIATLHGLLYAAVAGLMLSLPKRNR